jgi:cold shock CspA family protein
MGGGYAETGSGKPTHLPFVYIGDVMEQQRQQAEPVRVAGQVTKTFPNRGFFWIRGDNGVDYYSHISQLQAGYQIIDLRAGMRCSFVPAQETLGPTAEFIQIG